MADKTTRDASRQDREAEVARELFARERGEHPDMPFADFLARIEGEAREQVREERRRAQTDYTGPDRRR